MKTSSLALILGSAVAVSSLASMLTACGDDAKTGTPVKDAGTRDTSVTPPPDTGTTPPPPPVDGGPGPSGEAGTTCKSPAKIHPSDAGGVYCPFSAIGDAGNTTCTTQAQQCCQATKEAGVPSECVAFGTACDTKFGAGPKWECDSKLDCSGGKKCCGTGTNPRPDSFCPGTFYQDGTFKGTECKDDCGQSITICFTDSDCTGGKKCAPFKSGGKELGMCEP